jgi:glycosyltransferase involved in cell wall biosynthesis
VLPSEYENFANSVAESIACGTPVVVTDRCGISEFVEQRVGLVIPRTTEALTDALRRLLTDQTLRERFASGCPEVAARLSWDGLIGPMMDLYREVIAANK